MMVLHTLARNRQSALVCSITDTVLALKNVKPEVMTGMITPRLRIKIDPTLVVSRNLHLRRIPMVEIRSALIIFRRIIIVRIINVRIIIEPLPILRIGSCPLLTIPLLCRSGTG